jgi:hypothetical protein
VGAGGSGGATAGGGTGGSNTGGTSGSGGAIPPAGTGGSPASSPDAASDAPMNAARADVAPEARPDLPPEVRPGLPPEARPDVQVEVPSGDCRTTGCSAGSCCDVCRGLGGINYVCLPNGIACGGGRTNTNRRRPSGGVLSFVARSKGVLRARRPRNRNKRDEHRRASRPPDLLPSSKRSDCSRRGPCAFFLSEPTKQGRGGSRNLAR